MNVAHAVSSFNDSLEDRAMACIQKSTSTWAQVRMVVGAVQKVEATKNAALRADYQAQDLISSLEMQ